MLPDPIFLKKLACRLDHVGVAPYKLIEVIHLVGSDTAREQSIFCLVRPCS